MFSRLTFVIDPVESEAESYHQIVDLHESALRKWTELKIGWLKIRKANNNLKPTVSLVGV